MHLQTLHYKRHRLFSGCRAMSQWQPGSHNIATHPDGRRKRLEG